MVRQLHRVHVAIVWADRETHLLEFEDRDYDRMRRQTIPAFARSIGATSVIVSSPAVNDAREGVHIAVIARTIDIFHLPIVRFANADRMIGDFRATNAVNADHYGAIFEAIAATPHSRDR